MTNRDAQIAFLTNGKGTEVGKKREGECVEQPLEKRSKGVAAHTSRTWTDKVAEFREWLFMKLDGVCEYGE